MRTLSDMHTVALATAGHLLHFELGIAYEIFGNPPLGHVDDWYDVVLCGPGPVQVGRSGSSPTTVSTGWPARTP